MPKFAKGAAVRQIIKPIIGTVVGDFRVNQETGDIQIPVEWIDEAGDIHSRYFDESQLEADPDAAPMPE